MRSASTALATCDPITATADDLTTHGRWHGFGAMLGNGGVFVAATFLAVALRRDPAWASARGKVHAATALAWASVLVSAVSMGVMYDGEYGPGRACRLAEPAGRRRILRVAADRGVERRVGQRTRARRRLSASSVARAAASIGLAPAASP